MRPTPENTALTVRFLLSVLTLFSPTVRAGNGTIDDTEGDNLETGKLGVVYTGNWENQTTTCIFCPSGNSLGPSQVLDGTWHATSEAGATITLTFTGKSV
jgi:hypothetical protein